MAALTMSSPSSDQEVDSVIDSNRPVAPRTSTLLPTTTRVAGFRSQSTTAAPSSLIAEPIVLWIGDTFALNDPVVAAYDASGTFIPDVPIEILDPDTATRLLKKATHTLHQDYVAVEAGEKVIEIRSTCEGPPWVSANLVITIRETVE